MTSEQSYGTAIDVSHEEASYQDQSHQDSASGYVNHEAENVQDSIRSIDYVNQLEDLLRFLIFLDFLA